MCKNFYHFLSLSCALGWSVRQINLPRRRGMEQKNGGAGGASSYATHLQYARHIL